MNPTNWIRAFARMTLVLAASAFAQAPSDPRPLIAAQKEAMAKLGFVEGLWRGPATTLRRGGEKHTITQTERMGAFLDGSVKVIEGRGYEDDGAVSFNALGIISYDPEKKAYTLRSYALGRSGDFALTPKEDGFTWEIPQGPGKLVYTATVKDNTWHEVGDLTMPGRDAVRIFEMKLKRVGDTDWPMGTPVSPK